MTSALFEVAKTGQTANEFLLRMYRARTINSVLGAPLFTPWNIDEELPEVDQDAIMSIANDLPEYQSLFNAQSKKQDEWRARHGYRKGK